MSKPLTTAIEALTTYANTVTGASDQTLSEAVATLASGYGSGSGGVLDEFMTYLGDVTLHSDSSTGRLYLSSSWFFIENEKTMWLLFGNAPYASGYYICLGHNNDTDINTGWYYSVRRKKEASAAVYGSNYGLSALDSKYFTNGTYNKDNIFSVYKINEE